MPVHPGLMIRDEPCHNRGRHRGQPWRSGMNRVEPAHGLKQPGLTGNAVKYRGKPGRRREQPCLHGDGVGAIPAHSGNILVSTVINRAR